MQHFITEEHFTIQYIKQSGKSIRIIANSLSRSPCSITRELRRNALQDGSYSAAFAAITQKTETREEVRCAMSLKLCRILAEELKKIKILHHSQNHAFFQLNVLHYNTLSKRKRFQFYYNNQYSTFQFQ